MPPSKYGKYFDDIENNEENTENMMADTPTSDTVLVADNENLKNLMDSLNKNNSNLTNPYLNSVNLRNNFTAERENQLESVIMESVKKQWLMFIQQSILEQTGRKNNITSIPPSVTDPVVWILNRTGSVTTDPKNPDGESDGDEFVNKKIRSFYPSCDIPRNTDEEVWKDINTMNLFFNVDYNSGVSNGANEQGQEDTVNIASATLRLYRLPQENSTENCQKTNAHSLSDEDKQIRVSVYWYSRSLKKHKAVKRRLTDSRMVLMHPSNTSTPRQYIEFNVRPAAKTWVRGRNLGLGVVVEDMDGNQLNPAAYFKGAPCDTVGNVSTPIPIPTAFLDAHRSTLSLNNTVTPYDTLMPNLDICTIELTHNLSGHHMPLGDTSKIICRVIAASDDHRDVKYNSENTDTGRHIRHHHTNPDFRDKFVSKRVVMKNNQLHDLNSQMQLQNISVINR